MARKPARMYRKITQHPYTRREYIGGVPGVRIVQFDMGSTTGTFTHEVRLKTRERAQLRHVALESSRVAANRVLQRQIGPANFHYRIRTYPHHVLRENKQAVGAGADRVSDGMRRSFGKPVGTAARVYEDDTIMLVRVNAPHIDKAKEAFRRANMKLGVPCRIEIEQIHTEEEADDFVPLSQQDIPEEIESGNVEGDQGAPPETEDEDEEIPDSEDAAEAEGVDEEE